MMDRLDDTISISRATHHVSGLVFYRATCDAHPTAEHRSRDIASIVTWSAHHIARLHPSGARAEALTRAIFAEIADQLQPDAERCDTAPSAATFEGMMRRLMATPTEGASSTNTSDGTPEPLDEREQGGEA